MQTECNTDRFDFQPLEKREVRGSFDGGAITSDAGALLLREVEEKIGIIGRFAGCFTDHRDPELIEHPVEHLIAQRVFGLALGYEDLNDHDQLRHDPLLAVLVGKRDPNCYLPLYVFCGEHLLCAQLRPADQDAAAGSIAKLAGLVERIRRRWPDVQIIVRGDSGFCRDNLMSWCEEQGVDFILGLAKNSRLGWEIDLELELAKAESEATGKSARRFKDFTHRTRKSWSRERRVVGKVEHLAKGPNSRFVVTSLSKEQYEGRSLYEDLYSGRGEMENRIKEQQLMLFADRTSAEDMRANQIRLYLSSIAYVLLSAMRRIGLVETSLERAQCSTIRLKLLKVGALVRITVRKIWVSFSQSYPYQEQFLEILAKISGTPPVVLRC